MTDGVVTMSLLCFGCFAVYVLNNFNVLISDVDECTSNPCENGGICTNNVGGYSCNCDGTGYEGNICEHSK